MKRFLLLFVVLVATLSALPAIIGFQAQEQYQLLLNQFEQDGARLTQSEYRRGWFGSSAQSRYEITLQVPTNEQGAAQVASLMLVSDIAHGPLTSFGLGLAEITSQITVSDPSRLLEDYQVNIQTRMDINGEGVARIELPSLQLEQKGERPGIDFQGASGQIRFAAGLDQVQVEAQMPGLRLVTVDNSQLEVGRITLTSESSRGAAGLMLGGGVFSIQRLTFNEVQSGTLLALTGLDIDVGSSAQDDLVSAFANYRLQQLDVGGQRYGPAELKMGLGQLSAEVLGQIQQSMQEINSQRLSPEQRSMAAASVLLGHGPALLKRDPRLDLDRLYLVTPEGEIEGHLNIQAVGLEWSAVGDLSALIERLVIGVQLRMPEYYYRLAFAKKAEAEIVQELQRRQAAGQQIEAPAPEQLQQMALQIAQQQLQQLLAQDILLREGDALNITASLSDGLLSVNGKSFPLPIGR